MQANCWIPLRFTFVTLTLSVTTFYPLRSIAVALDGACDGASCVEKVPPKKEFHAGNSDNLSHQGKSKKVANVKSLSQCSNDPCSAHVCPHPPPAQAVPCDIARPAKVPAN